MLRHLRTFENLVELSLKTDDPAGAGRGAWPRPEEETAARWLGIYREAFHLLITLILLVTRQLFLKILEDNSFLGVVF